METKLNPKQIAFCEYYVASGNATESALKAGYSKNYAEKRIHQMLGNVGIKSYIDQLNAEAKSNRIADITEIQERLTSILRGEVKEEVVLTELIGDGKSESKIILKQASVKDRIKAGELLGKSKMMFSDKLQIDSAIPVMIVAESELDD